MSIFEDRPFIPKLEVKPSQKDRPKVARYWPGKAPEWAGEQDESDEENEEMPAAISTGPIKVERKSDRRLERLQGGAVDKEEALRRRRDREVVAEIVSVAKKEEEEEEEDRPARRPNRDSVAEIITIKTELPDDEDDDVDARRERARQQYLRQKSEEEEAMPVAAEEEKEESESGSEYETDSDYDEWSNRPTIQPVFVKKQERETIAERDKRIEEEEKLEELRLKQLEERKIESLDILREQLQRERIEQENAEKGAEDERIESDEEEEDEAKEYELWKHRELARIKRDKEEREAMDKEREETERRRNMTDAEIREIDKDKFVKDKKQLKFLQKYYHKGAFFREGEGEDIQNRDFSGATGEDLINKESLPKVMQVKNFGRSGRTKYTHLADQDTTQKDAPWAQRDTYTTQFTQKLGGLHGGFERPALKKRKMD